MLLGSSFHLCSHLSLLLPRLCLSNQLYQSSLFGLLHPSCSSISVNFLSNSHSPSSMFRLTSFCHFVHLHTHIPCLLCLVHIPPVLNRSLYSCSSLPTLFPHSSLIGVASHQSRFVRCFRVPAVFQSNFHPLITSPSHLPLTKQHNRVMQAPPTALLSFYPSSDSASTSGFKYLFPYLLHIPLRPPLPFGSTNSTFFLSYLQYLLQIRVSFTLSCWHTEIAATCRSRTKFRTQKDPVNLL